MMESDKGKYFNINFHPDLSNIQDENISPEVKKKESMEEDDKQLVMMTNTFRHILESKQKNKVPMLNLGKIVD